MVAAAAAAVQCKKQRKQKKMPKRENNLGAYFQSTGEKCVCSRSETEFDCLFDSVCGDAGNGNGRNRRLLDFNALLKHKHLTNNN